MEARVLRFLLLGFAVTLVAGAAVTTEDSAGSDAQDSENIIPQCGTGQVFKDCVSSSCAELTCANPEPTDECSRDCDIGCFCKDGLYRDSEKNCVPLDKCPKT